MPLSISFWNAHTQTSKQKSFNLSVQAILIFIFLFHWYISIESLGGHKFHYFNSPWFIIYAHFPTLGLVGENGKGRGIEYIDLDSESLFFVFSLFIFFFIIIISFCAEHQINASYKAMLALKEAIKSMLWISMEKSEIQVDCSGTRHAFENLEFWNSVIFFSSSPTFL